MANTKNRTNQQGKDQQILDGIKKDLQTMSGLSLGGTTYTPASLEALIQSRIDAVNEVVTAKATWQNAAKAYTALNTQVTVVVRDLKALVIGAFGGASPKLADFGFTPRKVTVRTPEQKAAAAAKAKATRKARNTMGPKAKLAVKGTVASATAPGASPVASSATASAPVQAQNGTAVSPSPVPEAPANASAKS